MFKLRSYLLFCVVLIFILSNSICVFAAEAGSGGIVVTQTKIILNAEQDQKKTYHFGVSNNGNEDMVVKIEKADFFIDDTGAFQQRGAGTTANSADKFISVKEPEFIMKPGENQKFDVALNKDMDYLLPEYISTILVRYIPKSAIDTKAEIKTYTQVAIIVRVLSGNMMKGSIDVSKPPLSLVGISGKKVMAYGSKENVSLAVKNNGLLTVEPKIEASVESLFSGKIDEISGIEGYIMPEQTRTYNVAVPTSSIFDIRTVNFTYNYSYAGKEFTQNFSYSFMVLSYQLIIGLLLLLAGIIFQTRLFGKRNKLLKQLLEQNKALSESAAASVINNAAGSGIGADVISKTDQAPEISENTEKSDDETTSEEIEDNMSTSKDAKAVDSANGNISAEFQQIDSNDQKSEDIVLVEKETMSITEEEGQQQQEPLKEENDNQGDIKRS